MFHTEGVFNVIRFSEQEKLDCYLMARFETGTEWIIKDQANDQATGAFGGIARAMFDRLFKFLIEKCNVTLVNPTLKREKFCAALDIAGFKIFKCNSSEQISIDFADKKLRQFSSHHMFVVEQEEHAKEGIDWAMVDLGMGLIAAVIMVEKSMGIWAILEEESLFPKATDKSF
jgi:Myosin heavy chain